MAKFVEEIFAIWRGAVHAGRLGVDIGWFGFRRSSFEIAKELLKGRVLFVCNYWRSNSGKVNRKADNCFMENIGKRNTGKGFVKGESNMWFGLVGGRIWLMWIESGLELFDKKGKEKMAIIIIDKLAKE